VLHSIASRGDEEVSLKTLRGFGLEHLFVAPRINWQTKPLNLVSISRELELALDSLVFVDNDPFEREQVIHMLPEVVTVEAARMRDLLALPGLDSGEVTPEARQRRGYYRAEQERRRQAEQYPSQEAFLEACQMRLAVRPMGRRDARRVAELLTRTHQLNTTGLELPSDDLQTLLDDSLEGPRNRVVRLAELTDRFGEYGTIGVAVVAPRRPSWTVEMLALSCRVLGRGIERAFLHRLLEEGKQRGFTEVDALLRPTGRNRAMRVLYQLSGLQQRGPAAEDGCLTFHNTLSELPSAPRWVTVR
jgi:FkbH-like protein